jgi:hypothetical protein
MISLTFTRMTIDKNNVDALAFLPSMYFYGNFDDGAPNFLIFSASITDVEIKSNLMAFFGIISRPQKNKL